MRGWLLMVMASTWTNTAFGASGNSDPAPQACFAGTLAPLAQTRAFGRAVALAEPFAFMAAPLDDEEGFTAGAVFVRQYDGRRWVQTQKLTVLASTSFDELGSDISVAGDILVAGAPGDTPGGANSGSAAVFRFDGAQWNFEQRIWVPFSFNFAFGTSVATDGERIAVGAPGGAVAYLFEQRNGNWSVAHTLAPPRAFFEGGFGTSIAFLGDEIIVGSPLDDEGGMNSGAVFVFRDEGDRWVQTQKVLAGDGGEGDGFGSDCALDDDTLIVGAPGHDAGGADGGAVYAYRRDGLAWAHEQKLVASKVPDGDGFGSTVAVQQTLLLVGSPGSTMAWAYRWDGRSWADETAVMPEGEAEGFGVAVALGGPFALVGADEDDVTLPGSGAAYLYVGLDAADCDDNGVVDGCETADGAAIDCNGNFVPDDCDIVSGTSTDRDGDGIPDECPALNCTADIASPFGVVDSADLLAVLNDWSCVDPPGPCAGDIAAPFGSVGNEDVLRVIDLWGPCPIPPPGTDDCEVGISAIFGTGPFVFDSSRSTVGGPLHDPQCSQFAAGFGFDVWFLWRSNCSGLVTLSTCDQTRVDTNIAVYEGSTCPTEATPPIACRDDTCGFQTAVTFEVEEGADYLIRMGTFPLGISGGTGQFTITGNGCPAD